MTPNEAEVSGDQVRPDGRVRSPQRARPGSVATGSEWTSAGRRPATRPKQVLAVVVAVAALFAGTTLTALPTTAAARTHLPTSCSRTLASASACQVITSFFEAVNRGDAVSACSLLGARLLLETGASGCPGAVALSRGTPFSITGARSLPTTVLVHVKVGLHELDHWRMLSWVAVVGRESGTLKILDTKRVV